MAVSWLVNSAWASLSWLDVYFLGNFRTLCLFWSNYKLCNCARSVFAHFSSSFKKKDLFKLRHERLPVPRAKFMEISL